MSEPFIGEIVAVAFIFDSNGFIADGNWLPCDGRKMAINQYSLLYSLLGTTYGGDGTTFFNLPNLNGGQPDPQARIAISQGQGQGLTPRFLGERLGTMQETLSTSQLPAHNHTLLLGKAAAQDATAGPGANHTTVAINPSFNGFVAEPANTRFAENAIVYDGGGQPHANNQPTTALWYCIAVTGIYPSFE